MRKFFCLLLCLYAVFVSNFVMAGDRIAGDSLVSKFLKNLGSGERMASFIQTKTFEKYNKSFVLTGKVEFVKDVGLLWKQENPKNFQFIATKTEYCLKNGVKRKIEDLQYIDKIKNVVDEVVSGHYDELYNLFDVVYLEDKKRGIWKLQLFPTYSKISKFIEKIQLSGNETELLDFYLDYVNGVVLSVLFDKLDEENFDEIKC